MPPPVIHNALLFLYAETPVHAGGPESVGGIDLPIQRETVTGLPVIWGQSLRGALRAHVERTDENLAKRLFGDPPNAGTPAPGTVYVGDGRLLAFPVATLTRTFAWATSAMCVARVARLGRLLQESWPVIAAPSYGTAYESGTSWGKQTVLGAYRVNVQQQQGVQQFAEHIATRLPAFSEFAPVLTKLRNDVLVVSDDLLPALTHEGADVVTRVSLDDDKQVKAGGLFVEEYLPAESIMVAHIGLGCSTADAASLAALLHEKPFFLGGSSGVGKGLCWATLHRGPTTPPPASTGSAQ